MEFIDTDGKDADFGALCRLLEESLEEAVGATVQRAKYAPMNTLEKIRDAVVVYDGDLPVACGGFRYCQDGVAEIKRVFVRRDYRGRGISKQLMERLENRARQQGYRALVLETNRLLVPAIGLYNGLGFVVIDNYGPYKDMPESVCMRKEIGVGAYTDIREARAGDLSRLLRLYACFGKEAVAETDGKARDIWRRILEDPNHHVIVADDGERLISSCVILIIPNLTHGGRPYALIENVVTDERRRRRGHATAVLNYAKDVAARENCYKIMLMTGSKLDSTLRFYEQAGYNRNDKTAFIQWL